MNLKNDQLTELNVWVNSIYRKFFHYNKWESVRECKYFLGRMDVFNLYKFRKLLFLKKLFNSNDPLMTNLANYLKFTPEYVTSTNISNISVSLNTSVNQLKRIYIDNFA